MANESPIFALPTANALIIDQERGSQPYDDLGPEYRLGRKSNWEDNTRGGLLVCWTVSFTMQVGQLYVG